MTRQRSLDDFGRDSGRRGRWVESLSDLCDDRLPERARSAERGEWPVHDDHCFRRLAYDRACRGKWTDVVDNRPYIDHATMRQLQAAVAHAQRMREDGPRYAWILQEMSLLWRDEMDPAETEYVDPEALPGGV